MPLAIEVDGVEPPPLERLEPLADAVLQVELGNTPQVSLLLCDDATIAQLNERYLGHLGPTDVLSFPLLEPRAEAVGWPDDVPFGEIVISVETAARQAAEFAGWDLEREVCLLLVHGLLHLCGWSDAGEAERKAMAAREDEHLKAAGLGPAPR